MVHPMMSMFRLALILCLMLTGIGLGAARGTVQIGGEMVLCTGQGVVVVPAADGEGGGQAHLCPDMALAMLVAVALPGLPDAPFAAAFRFTPALPSLVLTSQGRPATSARDPPV